MQIELPTGYVPRDYQLPVWQAFDSGVKRHLLVHHRRAGKDKTCINLMARASQERVGSYYYFLPTYAQGKKIIWDGMDSSGYRFLNHFPRDLWTGTPNSTEMKLKLRNGSIFQVVGSDNIDCYDDQTEILTERGWLPFWRLEEIDRVATLKDGFMEFSQPNAIVSHDYVGEMVSVQSKAIDLLVTPNHRFWVKSQKGVYKFKQARDLSPTGDMIPSRSRWRGMRPRRIWLPRISPVEYVCGKGRRVKQGWNLNFDPDDYCAFMGIFVTEGSTHDAGRGNYRTIISQRPGKGADAIAALVKRMGLNASYDGKNFVVCNKQLFEYCRQFGKTYKKRLPKDILTLDLPYLETLREWMVLGDGSRGVVEVFYSTSQRLMDQYQELLLKCGLSGNISTKRQVAVKLADGREITPRATLYQCVTRKSAFKRFAKSGQSYISRQPYKGKVYCVDVGGGVVKVRRNGKESWCGNSIVGTNPVGCVFSEYALQDPRGWDFIRPILRENGGWAVFNGTPRGKNHMFRMKQMAEHNDEWFYQMCTVNDTNVLTEEDIQAERDAGMDEELIQQEFYCSFEGGLSGAYYGKEMDEAEKDKRICEVPYDPMLPVDTWWDLGIGDATAIVFTQVAFNQIRVIDYYETSGEGLKYFIKYLAEKPYVYGDHIAPHDIEVREMGTGKSRLETARSLGLTFRVARKLPIDDGINAVRSMLPLCWFDRQNTEHLREALSSYRKEFDAKNRCYKSKPNHDWSSHAADAMRTGAVGRRRAYVPKKRDRYQLKNFRHNHRSWMSA